MAICTVPDCLGEIRSGKLYCEKHRARMRRHGNVNTVLKDHTPAEERWKKQYVVDSVTGCWNWTGPIDKRWGYGFIQDGAKKRHMASRFVYEQQVGLIPEGMELDHKCRNTRCVNPRHLDPVPHALNVRRGDAGIRNAEKTRCKYGHEFTPENTIINAKGHRNCRECQRRILRERMRRERGSTLTGPAQPYGSRTHCIHGHEFTPENTIIRKNGGRACRECGRRGQREYKRRKRAGVSTPRRKVTQYVKDGYVYIRMPDHPLADSRGTVAEHRMVLYDSIEPGSYPCHWCSSPVEWGSTLCVDHLDGDPSNNSRDNLVPSCQSCNKSRASCGNLTGWKPSIGA